MTATHIVAFTPNTSADGALNRPGRLARRQRAVAALASCVISSVLLGGVLFGMVDHASAPMLVAGATVTPTCT